MCCQSSRIAYIHRVDNAEFNVNVIVRVRISARLNEKTNLLAVQNCVVMRHRDKRGTRINCRETMN